ncbi:MAG TPA: PilT/PilU family type 4a pilus ATPase [Patescibacteria group bacterium]|nr:PilT/PilU family type 4a pilus ATPase [Patescibacteria group bacterium]
MELRELLESTIKNNASDLHLLVEVPPVLRIDGTLYPMTGYQPLIYSEIEKMVFSILTPEQKELLLANKELDFSFGFGGGEYGLLGRFRINAYFQRGYLSAAFRFLPPIIRTIDELNLPNVCHRFVDMTQGFVLVTGPTGQGKSTTLAAIINEVNLKYAKHILTIEDPIEYVYPKGNSYVSQREMTVDTHSWAMALRSALREDPDVVLVGEMRDPETMQAALTIAETGHVVFATLHTNSASQTLDRIVDTFPEHQRQQIRIQLAATLRGVISQRLLPKIGGGRIPAVEILLGTEAVASNIREGKTHLIDSVIQTSREAGMITMEDSLSKLVMNGTVSLDIAKSYTLHEDALIRLVK